MSKSASIEKILAFDVSKCISYKFWLNVIIICFYVDIVLTQYPNLLVFSNPNVYIKEFIWVILLTGLFLALQFLLFYLILLIVSIVSTSKLFMQIFNYIQSEKKDKMSRSGLLNYALINNRNDFLEIIKSHDLEIKDKNNILYMNFVLLILILLDHFFNGVINFNFFKWASQTNGYSYWFTTMSVGLVILCLIIVNAYSFLNRNDEISIDLVVQDKLKMKFDSIRNDN